LSIQIEGGKLLLLGPIYSLSALELETLREFIKENLYTRSVSYTNIENLVSPWDLDSSGYIYG